MGVSYSVNSDVEIQLVICFGYLYIYLMFEEVRIGFYVFIFLAQFFLFNLLSK